MSIYDTPLVTCTSDGTTVTCKHKSTKYKSAQASCSVDEDTQAVTCNPVATSSSDEISSCEVNDDGLEKCTPIVATISDDGVVTCAISETPEGAYRVNCIPTGSPFPTKIPPVNNIVGMSAAAVRTFSGLISTLMAGLCALNGLNLYQKSGADKNLLPTKILLVVSILVFLETVTLTAVYWAQANEEQENLAFSLIPALILSVIMLILLLIYDSKGSLVKYAMGGISAAATMLITFFFVAVFAK